MPTIAYITFNAEEARKLAWETDSRTAADIGYVVKNVMCESLGINNGGIRPFRIFDDEDCIRVLGYTERKEVAKPLPWAGKFISDIRFSYWSGVKGQEYTMELVACPVEQVTPTAGGRGKQRDVGQRSNFASPIAAYDAWINNKLSDPNTGCLPVGLRHFVETEHFRAIRKAKISGDARELSMPGIHVVAKVRVLNNLVFDRFLTTGIGRQKAFGYGSLFPSVVLDEFGI